MTKLLLAALISTACITDDTTAIDPIARCGARPAMPEINLFLIKHDLPSDTITMPFDTYRTLADWAGDLDSWAVCVDVALAESES